MWHISITKQTPITTVEALCKLSPLQRTVALMMVLVPSCRCKQEDEIKDTAMYHYLASQKQPRMFCRPAREKFNADTHHIGLLSLILFPRHWHLDPSRDEAQQKLNPKSPTFQKIIFLSLHGRVKSKLVPDSMMQENVQAVQSSCSRTLLPSTRHPLLVTKTIAMT